jgi:hypothetical protein
VKYEKNLNESAIEKLASGEVIAIRIKNFITRDHANLLYKKIIQEGHEFYINAPSIGRIGMAFYETNFDKLLIDKYFNAAENSVLELRYRCAPYNSPIDTLRCVLDETWPSGAQIQSIYGRKMFVGISRIVKPDVTFLAHHDIFHKDAPDSYIAKSLMAQFAANVYLQIPQIGGELQIWNNEMTPEEFDDIRGTSYGIDPNLLGNPDYTLKPQTGELIIFNSRKMHAVAPSRDCSRLSLSCFIGYRGKHSPLTFWS